MLAYIPYMDPMGNGFVTALWSTERLQENFDADPNFALPWSDGWYDVQFVGETMLQGDAVVCKNRSITGETVLLCCIFREHDMEH